MTSQERRELRQALITAGFVRSSFTRDHGDGRYDETWKRAGGNTVTISWGIRDA